MSVTHYWATLIRRPVVFAVIALLALIIAARLLAPTVIEWYLNNKVLDDMGDYTGHVADVDIALLRGAYRLEEIVIHKQSGDPKKPFFYLPRGDISLSWKSLLSGKLSADVRLIRPQLNILDAESEEDRQTGEGGDWRAAVDQALPMTLNRLVVEQGEVNFQNLESDPKVDLSADNVELTLANLTNVKDEKGERIATAHLSARLFEQSTLMAEARFDPFDYNDFDFATEAKDIRLTRINDFSKAYGNIDFASGHGDIFVELKAQDKKLNGYIKPLFEDVQILNWRQDVENQSDNPLEVLWEGVAEFVESIFTNRETEKLATQIDIEGDLNDTEIDSWGATWNVVKNAFVDALDAQFNQLTPLTE